MSVLIECRFEYELQETTPYAMRSVVYSTVCEDGRKEDVSNWDNRRWSGTGVCHSRSDVCCGYYDEAISLPSGFAKEVDIRCANEESLHIQGGALTVGSYPPP